MPINLPTECEIECDTCGKTETVDLVEYGGSPPTVGIASDELPADWTGSDDNDCEVFCPFCSQSREEEKEEEEE